MTETALTDLFYRPLIESHLDRFFVERPWLAARITAALDAPECRFVLLTGEPGSGKSSFIAWLAERHPDALRYFIRRGSTSVESSGDVHSFLLTIGHQFAAARPEAFTPDRLRLTVEQQADRIHPGGRMIGISVEDLLVSPFIRTSAAVRQTAEQVGGEMIGIRADRLVTDERLLDPRNLQYLALIAPALTLARIDPESRVLVLIDAVDELRFAQRDEGSGFIDVLTWLATCPELPDNIRVLVAARPDDGLLARFRGAQRHRLREVAIGSDPTEVRADLDRYAARVTAEEPVLTAALRTAGIAPERFWETVIGHADGNFQYADSVVRAVIDAGRHGREPDLRALARLDDLPAELDRLYEFFLRLVHDGVDGTVVELTGPHRQRAPAWDALYRPLLAALALAQEPLTPAAARALVGLPVDEHWVTTAMTRLAQFLDRFDHGYRLYHTSFRDFLISESTDPELRVDPGHWHGQVMDEAVRRHTGGTGWLTADLYTRRYLAVHAAGAGRLDDLMGDPGFLLAADPDVLLRELPTLRSAEAQALGWVYESAARRFGDRPVPERAAYLEYVALQQRAALLADAVRELDLDDRRLAIRWLHSWTWRPHHRIGRFGLRGPEAMAVSPDGDEIVLIDPRGLVTTVDRRTGMVVGECDIGAEVGECRAVCLGTVGDRTVAVVATEDDRVHVWDPATGTAVTPPLWGRAGFGRPARMAVAGRIAADPAILMPAPEQISALTVLDLGDWTLVAAGDFRGMLYAWDLTTGELVLEVSPFGFGNISALTATVLDGDPVLAAGDGYGRIAVLRLGDLPHWGGEAGMHQQLPDDPGVITYGIAALAFCTLAGRPVVAAADGEGMVHFWDAGDGAQAAEPLTVDAEEGLSALALLPGDVLAVGGRALSLYALADRRLLAAVTAPHDTRVVAIAPGRLRAEPAVITCGHDQVVNVWPLTGLTATVPALEEETAADGWNSVFGVASGRLGGRPVVVSGGSDSRLRLWDADTGALRARPIPTSQHGIRSLAMIAHHDGLLVATGGFDHTVALTSLTEAGSRPLAVLRGHDDYVPAVAFGRAGRRLVLASGSGDRTIRIWDVADRKCTHTLTGHLAEVTALLFLPTRRRDLLVSGGADGTIRVWDPRSGRQLGEALLDPDGVLHNAEEPPEPQHPADEEQWTADDYARQADYLREMADRALWNAEQSWQMAGAPPDPVWVRRKGGLYRPVNMLAAAPADGRTLVCAASVSGVRLWDLDAMAPGPWLPYDTGSVNGVLCQPVGDRPRLLGITHRGGLDIRRLGDPEPRALFDTSSRLFGVTVHPDDPHTVIVCGSHGLAAIRAPW